MADDQSSEANTTQHIFISYAKRDRECVEKVSEDLRRQGFSVWMDVAELTPGTPNWNRAIRTALNQSFAVVFVASQHTGQSDFVGTELAYASERGCVILPIWISGDRWSDCIPLMELTHTQYVDCRAEHYNEGLSALTQSIGKLVAQRTPNHFLMKAFRKERVESDCTYIEYSPIPFGCFCIELSDPDSGEELENTNAIAVNAFAYDSCRKMLDDIFVHYLSERFKPFTYGNNWVLAKKGRWNRPLALPLSWLMLGDRLHNEPESIWTTDNDCDPKSNGMIVGTHWVVAKPDREKTAGLLFNDEQLFRKVIEETKSTYFLGSSGYIKAVSWREADPREFKFSAVMYFVSYWGEKPSHPFFIVQTEKPLDEKWLEKEFPNRRFYD